MTITLFFLMINSTTPSGGREATTTNLQWLHLNVVKSHARNRIKLESTFAHLRHSWKTYKANLDLLETAFSAAQLIILKEEKLITH